jgi:uncharacterized protein YdhG (YjbR/CyaY superfamily)
MPAKIRTTARSIDDYLAGLSSDKRSALQKLRRIIHAAAPGAEECISYQLAAFRHSGRMLVAIGATDTHCAFYLMSTTAGDAFKSQLAGFRFSGGTIRFQPDKPPPAVLVRKLVKARIEETRR